MPTKKHPTPLSELGFLGSLFLEQNPNSGSSHSENASVLSDPEINTIQLLMRTSLHNNQEPARRERPVANLVTTDLSNLPVGATRLDIHGCVVHRVSGAGYSEEPRCAQMAGENFFQSYCYGTPLADLERVYDRGVQRGELYHFVDITIGLGPEARELTLFLYFHAATAQGWVFIEPSNAASHGETWNLPEVA